MIITNKYIITTDIINRDINRIHENNSSIFEFANCFSSPTFRS